ncbi:uncharacterized protein LOC108607837 [Drosophila busckii]|uniref:uncharacterized protein LOC108607837 n=1 Tax=Drosophila busckii TaxID=30019 RepID=UPI00083F271E|nr:uncharacterized protein LOC108607837 [Drosophila busckii]
MRILIPTLIVAILIAASHVHGASKVVQLADLQNVELKDSGRQAASTGAPNFVRLVIMRLIYGIASTMGVEDRLEDAFNGAFVPPNSDGLGFGDFGGGDDDGDGILGNIFDSDY